MSSLVSIANDVAKKKLYGMVPCMEELKKAIVASYIGLHPECNVTSCYTLGQDVEIGIITHLCPPNTVDLTTQDCNPIYVNRL